MKQRSLQQSVNVGLPNTELLMLVLVGCDQAVWGASRYKTLGCTSALRYKSYAPQHRSKRRISWSQSIDLIDIHMQTALAGPFSDRWSVPRCRPAAPESVESSCHP